MNRFKTLRVRFALWIVGWLVLVLVLLETFIYLSFAQRLAQSIDDALRLAATQLMLEVDVEAGDSVADFTRRGPFSIRILNLDGETKQVYGPYQELPPPLISSATLTQPGVFTTFLDPVTQHPLRIYTVPMVDDQQALGVIQIAQSLAAFQQARNQLLTLLLIVGPAVVTIAGVGGYLLAARALAPIDQISRTAHRISIEDLSTRLSLPPTDDEVGRLAATFNTMLARLDEGVQHERQFTADASHELRTPLTTMQTILSSTLARERTPAEYQQALSDVAEETGHMKLLIEGLLLLARHDASQTAPHEIVDLSRLLQDVTESFLPLAKTKGLELSCQLPQPLTLTGDSDGLIRLFVNVLENAIHYTQQGHITLFLRKATDQFIEVSVADTGIGIASEHLPRVFDRFFRIDESRTSSGAGLGLAIASSIAHAHGGTIRVESEVGKGTVFTVHLARRSELDPPLFCTPV
jgi:heavy metal sensor kinase